MAPLDISAFAATQLRLLEAELQAEQAETNLLVSQFSPTVLQQAGVAILNLQLASQRVGLGGKTILELELDNALGDGNLPDHEIRVGDIVRIKEKGRGSAKELDNIDQGRNDIDGVIVKVRAKSVSIAAEKDEAELGEGRLWIIKLANDVTYKRMRQVMKQLETLPESGSTTFLQVMFGSSSPTVLFDYMNEPTSEPQWINEMLNGSQKDAVRFALASKEVALIHGPPGTGKTQTVIEIILQLLRSGLRLLVCGPSNIAVDNIIERLASHQISMVRLGHPARLLPSVLDHSLDVLTRTSDAASLLRDIRKEVDAKQSKIRKTRTGLEKRVIYEEIRELRKEFRKRERECVQTLIRNSKVVLSTLHGAGNNHLRHEHFDVVIIDEASQALEAQCWVALLTAKKAVLAGDHLQLPPTVKSSRRNHIIGVEQSCNVKAHEDNSHASLEWTLFDRLLELHGESIKRMLVEQYRMHEMINAFPSSELYQSKLVASDIAKYRILSDMDHVRKTEDTSEPLIFYDTQGGDFSEKEENSQGTRLARDPLSESKSNDMEVAIVRSFVHRLVNAGVSPDEIAVITPYNAQVLLLARNLREQFPTLEMGSVDGFQGREKNVVIVSLVRSNENREVGFLAEKRRLNVAMTRARRQLVVVGDSETIAAGSKYLRRWMSHLEEHADLRYPNPVELQTS